MIRRWLSARRPLPSTSEDGPWRTAQLDRIPPVPGMLGPEELQFLYFSAQRHYTGAGDIVDAGAFLGASAAAMGAGLRDNPQVTNKTGRIYSYDFFEFGDYHQPYIGDRGLKPGDDTLPLFHEYTRSVRSHIIAKKGDICAQTWSGGDIEVLFVDFTQHWDHHEFVVRTFYPHLIPGRSLLIHQDFVFTVAYWLHIFMEHYARCFEWISPYIPNATAAWLVKSPLPREALKTPLNRKLPFAELLALLDRSRERYTEPLQRGVLACARGRMLLHGLGPDRASDYVKQLAAEYDDNEAIRHHIVVLASEIDLFRQKPWYRDDFFFH
jgi:hypothetical protein